MIRIGLGHAFQVVVLMAAALVDGSRVLESSLGDSRHASYHHHPHLLLPRHSASLPFVRAMLKRYKKLHDQMMTPLDHPGTLPLSERRFYVAGTYRGNSGNQIMVMLTHLLRAIQSGRALIYDGWLAKGFEHPVAIDYRQLPGELLAELNSTWEGSKRTSWLPDREVAYCQANLVAESEVRFHIEKGPGAPDPVSFAVNPYSRPWFLENVGHHVHEVLHWFFQIDEDLASRAAEWETRNCGGPRMCDIGIHIRRGRPAFDQHYFPAGYRGAYDGTYLDQYVECAHRIAEHYGLGKSFKVVVASDHTDVAKYVVDNLQGQAAFVEEIRSRPEELQDTPGDAQQSVDAQFDLALLMRTKFVIGTRFSTFSMMIAGLQERPFHFMVHPGQFDRCLLASSVYHSVAQIYNPLTGPGFSPIGDLRDLSCMSEPMMMEFIAFAGNHNPYIESWESVHDWDGKAGRVPAPE